MLHSVDDEHCIQILTWHLVAFIPNVDLLILILCMYCPIKYAWLYTFSVEVAADGGAEVG